MRSTSTAKMNSLTFKKKKSNDSNDSFIILCVHTGKVTKLNINSKYCKIFESAVDGSHSPRMQCTQKNCLQLAKYLNKLWIVKKLHKAFGKHIKYSVLGKTFCFLFVKLNLK